MDIQGKTTMKHEPLIFSLNVADFDLKKLPVNAEVLLSDRKMLESAISQYYAQILHSASCGDTQISISNGVITVKWMPESGYLE